MPKGSPKLTEARREEIINACEKLYQTMSFKEITIKEIGNVREAMEQHEQMTKDEFADMLARSLEKRAQLLKILSMIPIHVWHLSLYLRYRKAADGDGGSECQLCVYDDI